MNAEGFQLSARVPLPTAMGLRPEKKATLAVETRELDVNSFHVSGELGSRYHLHASAIVR